MVRLPEILVEEERETHGKACALSANNLLSEVYNNAGLTMSTYNFLKIFCVLIIL